MLPLERAIEALNSIVNNPTAVIDVTADDSDKTFVVPANKTWEVLSLMVDFESSADSGSRQVEVEFTTDEDVLLYLIVAAVTQAASLQYIYMLAQGVVDDAALFDTNKIVHLLPSGLLLPAGFKVRVRDSAAIAATADDMLVRMLVNERQAV